MIGRVGVLLALAVTLTGCPGIYRGDDFGIVAYVKNDTTQPLFVRNNSNPMSPVVLLPPGTLGSTGFTVPGERISWFNADCDRLGWVTAPDERTFLVHIIGENSASIESIDPSVSENAVALDDAEDAPMACYGVATP
jgi:hypothetical protein